jgi:phage terminase large subunit
MAFTYTTAISKLRKLSKRKKIIQGGTSAGKTFGILPVLIDRATKTPRLEISVVSETIPHLRRGAIKDFLKIMDWTGRLIEANWNKTLLTYRFANGSYIEFFSAEQESKLRGARRNILYINEANNISFESYHQLAIRTSDEIWIDFNPTSQFWAHTELLRDEDSDHIILTYKDNEALSESIIKEIESAQEKGKTSSYWANWWKVYGLGEIGSLQGVVFDNWKQIDFVPKEAKLLGYGMDFGYTNDPTTLVAIYLMNNELYLDELIYTTNLNNNEIGNRLKALNITRPTEIVCDSAEPKSINELRLQGFNTQPAQKGPDSIRIGIDILKRYEMHVTQNSTNLIKELRAYQWDVDKEGKQTGKPVDHSNHAIDAIRYFALNKLNNRPRGKYVVLNV